MDGIRSEFSSIYEEHLRGSESVATHSLQQANQAPSVYRLPMLLELARELNEEMQALVGNKFSAGTLKNYRTFLRTLEELLRIEYQKLVSDKSAALTIV